MADMEYNISFWLSRKWSSKKSVSAQKRKKFFGELELNLEVIQYTMSNYIKIKPTYMAFGRQLSSGLDNVFLMILMSHNHRFLGLTLLRTLALWICHLSHPFGSTPALAINPRIAGADTIAWLLCWSALSETSCSTKKIINILYCHLISGCPSRILTIFLNVMSSGVINKTWANRMLYSEPRILLSCNLRTRGNLRPRKRIDTKG